MNPDELYSEWDYADAARAAEAREYHRPDQTCQLCGNAVQAVSDRGLCARCEPHAGRGVH